MIPDLEVAPNADGRDVLWRVEGGHYVELVHRAVLDAEDPRLWDALLTGLRDRGELASPPADEDTEAVERDDARIDAENARGDGDWLDKRHRIVGGGDVS